MHQPMSDRDMTQQPITAQPRRGASGHVSRATLWLANNKPPWKTWPYELFKIFEERSQTIAYDQVQELIDSRQSKKPVSCLMLSLSATRFSRWPVVMLLRNRGRDWRRPPPKNKRPIMVSPLLGNKARYMDTQVGRGGNFGWLKYLGSIEAKDHKE